MSRQNVMQNGIVPHLNGPPPQMNSNYHPAVNNGPISSQSSRDASPVPQKYSNASQIKGSIPTSQLPPMRPDGTIQCVISSRTSFKTSTPILSPEQQLNRPQLPVQSFPNNQDLNRTQVQSPISGLSPISRPPPVLNHASHNNQNFIRAPIQQQQQMHINQPPLPPVNSSHPPLTAGTTVTTSTTGPQMSALHSKRYPQTQPQAPPNLYQPTAQNQSFQYPEQSNVYNQQQFHPQQQQQQHLQQNYQQQVPQQSYQQQQQQNLTSLNQQMSNLNVMRGGYNKMWGNENFDLLQHPNILTEDCLEPPKVTLGQEFLNAANCSPEIFRCTMTKIPESNSLLQKSRLPLGVLIHPFKDLNHLPVIQCNTIVRCRACRTYINPFIMFMDAKRWKCNLCYRVNELPEEFQYDPVSKSYGDPSRRPEIKSSTIEYIAPSEYMLRPPQPAVYLFLLDVSRIAVETGYLKTVCDVITSQLDNLPGDARTQVGFLAYNSTLRFYSLAEGFNQPHEMIVTDIDDIFLPCPDNLLVNLKESKELVSDLLVQLPLRYENSFDNGSALGAALQVALKMMSGTGGRVTVFQATLPTIGPGALTVREDPNQRAGKEAPHLNPATDFYKRLALDCSGHQIAVDLFIINAQYVDIATLSGISRFSGGCMYHFPLFKASRTVQANTLERCLRRYLSRKIGLEAVMRIRCTRGLSIHTFHGNFFVRSTDLLSLPNVNPDAGFAMQVSIDENLTDLQSVCFQAALLYTSSKGERRIRVHTLCLPIISTLTEVLNAADQQCIVGILAKMAVDRSLQSNLSDARDAFINVAIDILASYKLSLNMGTTSSGLLVPRSLKLLPLYILALLKYSAFRTGQSTRLDDRLFAMCEMKTLPLTQLLQHVYPDLYSIHALAECPTVVDADGAVIPHPNKLQLTSRNIDSYGAYLLDTGREMIIYVCQKVSQTFLTHTLGVPNFNSIPDECHELLKIDNVDNQRLHTFIDSLNDEKPFAATLHIIRESSPNRTMFMEHLIEDRFESALSYNEFLQHLKTQVK